MARPTRFRDRWRIRWTDAAGRRQSDVFSDRQEAVLAPCSPDASCTTREHERERTEPGSLLRDPLVLEKMGDQVERQRAALDAAGNSGMKIRWYFKEQETAQDARAEFNKRQVKNIEVIGPKGVVK